MYHTDRGALPPGMNFSLIARQRYSGWLVRLLPYVDQAALWMVTQKASQQTSNWFLNPPHLGHSTVATVYTCPADDRLSSPQKAKRTGHIVSLASYLGVSGRDTLTRDGVLFRDSKIRLLDIPDGTSNTLLAGERPPTPDFQFGWWYAGAGQRLTGSGDMVLGVRERNFLSPAINFCPVRTYPYQLGSRNNQCNMFHFWSEHAGGA